MTKYAYLGPEGTFTEAALRSLKELDDEPPENIQPSSSVIQAVKKIHSGDFEAAMIPLENSVEGSVSATVDSIANYPSLLKKDDNQKTIKIVREVLLPVRFVLASQKNSVLDNIKQVSTHPHAWAQCSTWIHQKLPSTDFIAETSTAAAAAKLSTETSSDASSHAVICSSNTAEKYNLKILASNIGNNPHAMTRFILVASADSSLAKAAFSPNLADQTNSSKTYVTTVTLALPQDKPGALIEVLHPFVKRGINLSRIESRPTGEKIGDYFFSIDLEGHENDQKVRQALTELKNHTRFLDVLGSYPRADLWT